MSRVRIWVSGVQGIGHALIIDQGNGQHVCYSLKMAPAIGDRVGCSYPGLFNGHRGTYFDLPVGFPTDNPTAALRLRDPSIPGTIQKLIRENFPLPARASSVVQLQQAH